MNRTLRQFRSPHDHRSEALYLKIWGCGPPLCVAWSEAASYIGLVESLSPGIDDLSCENPERSVAGCECGTLCEGCTVLIRTEGRGRDDSTKARTPRHETVRAQMLLAIESASATRLATAMPYYEQHGPRCELTEFGDALANVITIVPLILYVSISVIARTDSS